MWLSVGFREFWSLKRFILRPWRLLYTVNCEWAADIRNWSIHPDVRRIKCGAHQIGKLMVVCCLTASVCPWNRLDKSRKVRVCKGNQVYFEPTVKLVQLIQVPMKLIVSDVLCGYVSTRYKQGSQATTELRSHVLRGFESCTLCRKARVDEILVLNRQEMMREHCNDNDAANGESQVLSMEMEWWGTFNCFEQTETIISAKIILWWGKRIFNLFRQWLWQLWNDSDFISWRCPAESTSRERHRRSLTRVWPDLNYGCVGLGCALSGRVMGLDCHDMRVLSYVIDWLTTLVLFKGYFSPWVCEGAKEGTKALNIPRPT